MLRPFFFDLEAEDAVAEEGVSTVVRVEGGLYMLLGRRLRLPGPRSSESSLSPAMSTSRLVMSESALLALRSLEIDAAGVAEGVPTGEVAELSSPSLPPFTCLAALKYEEGRDGGGEGEGRRRLGSLRVRVVVRRAGVWSLEAASTESGAASVVGVTCFVGGCCGAEAAASSVRALVAAMTLGWQMRGTCYQKGGVIARALLDCQGLVESRPYNGCTS